MTRYLEKYRELNRAIGRIVRHIRNNKGISQMRLAEELDISYQQVQKYEYGRSQFTVSRLRQIADVLGVSMLTFIDEKPSVPDIDSHIWLSRKEARVIKLLRRIKDKRLMDSIVNMIENTMAILEEEEEEEK